MRSPAERASRIAEAVLRLAAVAAIAWALWLAVAPPPARGLVVVDGTELPAALRRWSVEPAPDSVHAALGATPDATTRDWLAALAASGTRVSWHAADAPPIAVAAAQVRDPAGGVRVSVAAPRGAIVSVHDGAGPIDTVRVRGAGATLEAVAPVGTIAAGVGGVRALRRVPPAEPAGERNGVLVVARAGWEAKFVVAALEERGWRVDARLAVAPGALVEQGAVAPDVARHAVVVALDSAAAALAPAIARFVRSGGGLVLGADAARLPALAALAPGRSAALVLPPAARAAGDVEPSSLPYRPVALRADGVALERRDDAVVVAARRAGAGRVALVGLEETWRWRLAGAGGAVAMHRAWWSRVVASVAPAGAPETDAGLAEAAPLAAAFDRLGAPRGPGVAGTPPERGGLPAWAFVAVVAALLGEWLLRRLRGAR